MSRRLEMIFDPKVNNVSGVEQLAAAMAEVQSRTQLAGANLEGFRQLTQGAIASGQNLGKVYQDAARGVGAGTSQIQQAAQEIVNAWKLEEQAAKAAAKAATDAAEEIAKAKKKEADAAKKAAQELKDYAASIRQSIQNPLGALAQFGEQFALTFGRAGVNAAGFALALGIVAKKAIDMVRDFGNASRETLLLAARLDLSASQARLLQVESSLAGVNVHNLEYSMQKLSGALEDSTGSGKHVADAMHRMGIAIYGSGLEARDIGVVLQEVIQKLASIKDPTERAREGFALLGRGWKEISPLVNELNELRDIAHRLGADFDDSLINKGGEVQRAFKQIGIAYDVMAAKLSAEIAPIIIKITPQLTGWLAGGKAPGDVGSQILGGLTGVGPVVAGLLRAGTRGNGGNGDEAGGSFFEGDPAKSDPNMDAAFGIYDRDKARGKAMAEAFKKRYAATEEGLKSELRDLEQKQTKLSAALSSGEKGGLVEAAGERDFQKNELQIESIKARLKANKDLASILRQVQEIEARANESGLTGVAKLIAQRDEVIKRLHLEGAMAQRVKVAYQEMIEVEQEKEAKAFSDSTAHFQDKLIRGQFERAQRGALSLLQIEHPEDTKGNAEAAYKNKVDLARQAFEFEDQRIRAELQGLEMFKASQENLRKLLEDKDNARLALQGKLAELAKKDGDERIKTEQKILDIQLQGAKQDITDRATHAIRLGKLNAAPGEEVHAIVQAMETQKQLAIELYQIELVRIAKEVEEKDRKEADAKALIQLMRDFAREERESEIEIATLRKKGLDDYRATAGKIFDALVSRGSGGLQAFFQGELKTIEKQIFVNASSLLYSTFQENRNKFKIPGQENADGTLTTFGKLLQGTPFGIPPEQQFQSQTATNTARTVQVLGDIYGALTGTSAAALGIPGVGGSSLPGFPAGIPGFDIFSKLAQYGFKIPGFNSNGGGFETGGNSINLPFYGSGSTVGGGSASANSVLLDFPFTSKSSPFSFANGNTSLAAGLFNGGGPANAAISAGASAAALYGGVTTALHDFRQGGAQGVIGGIGSLAGTAALFDPEPISKAVLAGVALAATVVSSLFGDPKANRDASIRHELTNNRYYAPLPKRMTIDESGNLVDFSSTNAVRSYQGSWETRQDAANPITGVPVIVNVHALDNKSIIDHGPAIAEAVRVAVNAGRARSLTADLKQQMMPR